MAGTGNHPPAEQLRPTCQWRERSRPVLANGRSSQPFLPGRSPAAQVSRTRRQSSLRPTVTADKVPEDRARFREIGHRTNVCTILALAGTGSNWPPNGPHGLLDKFELFL